VGHRSSHGTSFRSSHYLRLAHPIRLLHNVNAKCYFRVVEMKHAADPGGSTPSGGSRVLKTPTDSGYRPTPSCFVRSITGIGSKRTAIHVGWHPNGGPSPYRDRRRTEDPRIYVVRAADEQKAIFTSDGDRPSHATSPPPCANQPRTGVVEGKTMAGPPIRTGPFANSFGAFRYPTPGAAGPRCAGQMVFPNPLPAR